MKSRGEVIVGLSAGRVSLSLVSNGRPGEARVLYESARPAETFTGGLAALRDPLARLVADSRAGGMLARVVFTSPAAGAGVFSCAKKAGKAAATRAAMLALGESTSLDMSESPHAIRTLVTDAEATEGAAQIHSLGVASSDEELGAIMMLVQGAGLRFGGATPSGGVGVNSAIRMAMGGTGVSIVVHVGDHETTIVGEVSGRLSFVRQAPIGVESLVEALTREPIADTTGTLHSLERGRARAIVLEHGIPAVGQEIQIAPGVMSRAVLPMLQSTLQRLVVETKQSSRFGLTEEHRSQAILRVGGIGSCVPRLGSVVGELSGLRMESVSPDSRAGALPAEFRAWMGAEELLLYPKNETRTRVVALLRRGLVVGAAAALLVMGVSWGKTRFDLNRAEADIVRLTRPQAADERAKELAEQVRVGEVYLAATSSAIQAGSPTRVRSEGLLVALGESASSKVHLTNLDLDAGEASSKARISGKVAVSPGADPTQEIGKFLDALSRSAVVASCRLDSTRRGTGADDGMLFFEIDVELVRLPGASVASAVPATGGEP